MTFLEAVLAATSGPPCPAAEARRGTSDAADRELVAAHMAGCPSCRAARAERRASAWRRFVLRPRFALEAAYVGAVVLCAAATLTDFHVRAMPDLMRTMISQLKEKP